jgi:GT2 family glycosyltransferase
MKMLSEIESQIYRERAGKWPKVAIIILNWNGWQDTIECLESIKKVDYEDLEVIVVDNASKDASIEKILSWCSQNRIRCQQLSYGPDDIKIKSIVKPVIYDESSSKGAIQQLLLIKLPENTGFCLGNNIGMKQAAGNEAEIFLILNNDTIVTPNFLKPMVEVVQQEENIGLVGGIICYAENPDLIWFAGGSFNKYLESARAHDREFYSAVAFDRIFNTDWVSGCMTLIPRRVYDRLGGYYEGFFIWSEEWDYSLRAKNAGYRLVIASKGRIFHKEGRSLGIMKPLSYYYGTRNRLMLKSMYLSRSLRWPFLTFFLLSRIPRYTYLAVHGRWDLVKAGSSAILDYFLGRTGKWMNHAD